MKVQRDRRQFLGAGLALAGTAALPLRSLAASATTFGLTRLTDRLWLVEGAAANIVIASAGNELVMVDGGSQADSRALGRLLEQHFPGRRLRALFNTHWHHAQTGFNAAARKLGADVIAHENTRLWLTTVVNSRWEGRIYKPVAKDALPNRTFFYDPQVLDLAGTRIEYVHLGQAHTDGDIYVRFPDDNVIVVGDVLTPGRYPIVDTASNGYLGGINTALRNIAALCDERTRVVPGSGAVAGVAALQEQEQMGNQVLVRMSENYRKGGTFEEFLAAKPTAEFDARFGGDPRQFLKLAYDSAWYQVNPMGGLTTGQPPAGRGR